MNTAEFFAKTFLVVRVAEEGGSTVEQRCGSFPEASSLLPPAGQLPSYLNMDRAIMTFHSLLEECSRVTPLTCSSNTFMVVKQEQWEGLRLLLVRVRATPYSTKVC